MASQEPVEPSTVAINRGDPGWKFCKPVHENRTAGFVCNFCGKITWGGITRMKEHLMGKKGNCKACTKCPKEVREELNQYVKNKMIQESEAFQRVQHDLLDDYGDSDEERALDEGFREVAVAPNVGGSKRASKKGPIDLFLLKPETAIQKKKKEKIRQSSIREACNKELTARVHQYIARFWYQAGLSFNMIKLQSFQDMLTAVGQFGPNLKPPSFHDIRVPLLNKELAYTDELLQSQKEQWGKFGCSIMSDGWIDRKGRSIMNILVNCPAGTMFIKSIDVSDIVKTGQKIFELLDAFVDEIGEEKVVQLITDNGSNYVLAGELLQKKRPNLYWTPCAAHCIDLMLEDIGKLPLIKKTVQRAISLVGFIYNHLSTLSLLRFFTNKRELVRHAVTRFATSFLTLERIHKEKGNLRKMFVSNEWTNNKLSKEAKGKEATKIVLMPSFWNNIVYTLKVMAPLVRVLRLVDSEKKPAMGYIYEAMEKAKEAIMISFGMDESKYKDVFEIIDNWWNCQLHRPLHAAGHFLNPELFYNNPNMEFDFEVTNGLYLCIEVITQLEECNEWLVGQMDGDGDGAGNERVFGDENGDDALNWETVFTASGIGEPTTNTRLRTKKRKEAPSNIAAVASRKKKGVAAGSSSRKGKEKVTEVVEVEDEPVIEENEPELEGSDFEDSEEEAEGYASLSDNDNDDYIGEAEGEEND